MKASKATLKKIFSDVQRRKLTDAQFETLIDSLWRDYLALYAENYLRGEGFTFPRATGNNSVAIGEGALANSFREIVMGSYPADTEALSETAWNILDLLFVIGNGADVDNRSNAVEVFKSGLVKLYNAILIGEYDHGAVAPVNGMLQVKASTGNLQLRKGGSWVDLLNSAPSDGKIYGQKDGDWSEVSVEKAFTDLTDVIDEDYIGKAWYVPRVSDNEETLELEETEELETVLAKLTELADCPPSYTGFGGMILMVNVTEDGVSFVTSLPVYADNTAALAGGLVAGNIYRTSDGTMKMVY